MRLRGFRSAHAQAGRRQVGAFVTQRDCAGMRGKMEEGDDSTGPWLWGIRGSARWVCRKRHVYVHVL